MPLCGIGVGYSTHLLQVRWNLVDSPSLSLSAESSYLSNETGRLKVASIHRDPSGNFHVHFRFSGQRFKRSLHTKHQRKAEAAASHIEENIRLIGEGRLVLPDEVDIPTYLLSDGKLAEQPKMTKDCKLGALFPKYQELVPDGAVESTTLYTTKIHLDHVVRVLGASRSLRSIGTSELQHYITKRSKESGRRGTLSAVTIRKEIASFRALWNWAVTHELVSKEFPRKGLVFPKHDEKPPFQTWAQIERQIERDKLDREQSKELWESLFLSVEEINQLLAFIEKQSVYPALHTMCLLAAHTGCRRSEICRARVADFDFESSTFVVQERKRSRQKRTTRRVPLTAVARQQLAAWIRRNESGSFIFPDTNTEEHQKTKNELGSYSPSKAGLHLKRVLKGSKWEQIHGWHTFRHSFISNCACRSVDQRFIDAWVGHQTDEQRLRYRHLFPDTQQAVIDSVFLA